MPHALMGPSLATVVVNRMDCTHRVKGKVENMNPLASSRYGMGQSAADFLSDRERNAGKNVTRPVRPGFPIVNGIAIHRRAILVREGQGTGRPCFPCPRPDFLTDWKKARKKAVNGGLRPCHTYEDPSSTCIGIGMDGTAHEGMGVLTVTP